MSYSRIVEVDLSKKEVHRNERLTRQTTSLDKSELWKASLNIFVHDNENYRFTKILRCLPRRYAQRPKPDEFVDIKELIYIWSIIDVANAMQEANTPIPHLVVRTYGAKGKLLDTVWQALRGRDYSRRTE